ncbi:MAG: hypothetical protein D6729_10030 [Deltaproteobacteria bacterium]|nr:MAG: hypothetical protein D6729_10030 [Deltaproteobacteria bacterium]
MHQAVTCDRCHHCFEMYCPDPTAEAARVSCPLCGDQMLVFLAGELRQRAGSHHSQQRHREYRSIGRAPGPADPLLA